MTVALLIGAALALSSTAFVLQMLAEKKQLTTNYGRAAFSILLFQDLVVIPIIAIIPLLGASTGGGGFNPVQLATSIIVLLTLILGGRWLLRPILSMVAKTGIPELFTATALLVVIGAALLMQLGGMSMVLGAFIAGMLLADSEYRHQLEADIGPFKGLLLGLFFIAVGMSVDLALLLNQPLRILAIVAILMSVKAVILVGLAGRFGMCDRISSLRLAASMSQGGEFAFVIFSLATAGGILPAKIGAELTLAVTASMLLTPVLFVVAERLTQISGADKPEFDTMPDEHNEVIIAGFGRVGQIVGRLLRMNGTPFTALDVDADQVYTVRKYGNKVHYGDATRLDVLRAAGANSARLFVIATPDMEASLTIAETLKRHFPNLTVIARARNRRHAHKLMDLGVKHIFRDTLLSSVAMGERVFAQLGLPAEESQRLAAMFVKHDEELLEQQFAVHDSEEKLIQSTRETERELDVLLRGDLTNQGQ
jgi:Kef-type K+ transport system membrane component KefB/voltage-gated potassium channel Kch